MPRRAMQPPTHGQMRMTEQALASARNDSTLNAGESQAGQARGIPPARTYLTAQPADVFWFSL